MKMWLKNGTIFAIKNVCHTCDIDFLKFVPLSELLTYENVLLRIEFLELMNFSRLYKTLMYNSCVKYKIKIILR